MRESTQVGIHRPKSHAEDHSGHRHSSPQTATGFRLPFHVAACFGRDAIMDVPAADNLTVEQGENPQDCKPAAERAKSHALSPLQPADPRDRRPVARNRPTSPTIQRPGTALHHCQPCSGSVSRLGEVKLVPGCGQALSRRGQDRDAYLPRPLSDNSTRLPRKLVSRQRPGGHTGHDHLERCHTLMIWLYCVFRRGGYARGRPRR